jgi:DNA polymerase III alpha subunit
MDTIKDRIEAARKAGQADSLTAKKWEAKEGVILMGEYMHRELIQTKGSNQVFEIVTVKNETGLWNTMVSTGTFNLAEKPPVRGDLLEINFHAEPSKDKTQKPFLRAQVILYHTGPSEPTHF